MKRNKAFTLIELVSVLVILAILALIVTPLVLNIIKKARTAADKRSIDAYGRSIELAVADYLLDKGDFPTIIDQLTIEYSGDEVVCSTTQLKDDGSVYLAECTVGGRTVSGYTYGKGGEEEEETPAYTAYSIGDQVTYNNVDYYVIEDSAASEQTVKLLKAEPLTYEEIGTYANGTGASTYNNSGYGGMQYHSSSSDYSTSYIKTTVDAWKTAEAPDASEARLITFDELKDNLGYTYGEVGTSMVWHPGESTPSWVYNNNDWYWTMSPYEDSASSVWRVNSGGGLNNSYRVDYDNGAVRPVITLSKFSLSS